MDFIKIKRLTLENFKCHAALTLDFEGKNASIYGDNATGKTTVYDALTWLLFGKDSRGNGEKNIEIKPLDSEGKVKDHLAETAVEAVLMAGGEEITLRRTLKEIWTTKKGHSAATYDGNTSEYYIDGVPVKKYAFADKIAELVDEDVFKMLTSVSYFAGDLSWQDRRTVLFQIAGVSSDAEIMATDERFLPLMEGMGKLDLDSYKKKLLAEKKKYVGAKTEIPARISEVQKTIEDISRYDFDGIRAEIEVLTANKERLEAELLSLENDTASEKKRMELRELNLEIEKLEAENREYRRSQSGGDTTIQIARQAIANFEGQIRTKEGALKGYERTISEADRQINACRERWMAANKESFKGGVCSFCGQPLPADKLTAAKDRFEAQKKARLRDMESAAAAHKSSRANAEEQIAALYADIESLKKNIESAKDRIAKAEACRVEIRDMDGYAERKEALNEQSRIVSRALAELAENSIEARGALAKELSGVRAEIARKNAELGREGVLSYAKDRMEMLRADAAETARRLDELEQMLFLIDEYSRYKTRYVEDSINGLFRLVKFRLFREQANGGIEDRCDVTYDGIPYINLNNGAKINVGIDIIMTLSHAFGISVPLFVDNAESVTHITYFDGQIIRLAVNEYDKELRVTYEN